MVGVLVFLRQLLVKLKHALPEGGRRGREEGGREGGGGGGGGEGKDIQSHKSSEKETKLAMRR